jgi:hypothetical protein
VLVAGLICSDVACGEERDVFVDALEELDGFPCECGHGFVLLRVSEVELV